MSKSKKLKRNRSPSISTQSDNDDSVNPISLIKRIKNLERELLQRNSHSRSRSRSRHESRYRRSRSNSSSPRRAFLRSRQYSSDKDDDSSDRRLSRPRADAALPPVVAQSPKNKNNSACSAVAAESGMEEDACSVVSQNSDEQVELVIQNDISLPEDVMEILGDDPDKIENNSFQLHEVLIPRWNATLRDGLKKEDCLNLLNKYDIPINLANLAPPKLNPEITGALQKPSITRDHSQSEVQNQLGKGLHYVL